MMKVEHSSLESKNCWTFDINSNRNSWAISCYFKSGKKGSISDPRGEVTRQIKTYVGQNTQGRPLSHVHSGPLRASSDAQIHPLACVAVSTAHGCFITFRVFQSRLLTAISSPREEWWGCCVGEGLPPFLGVLVISYAVFGWLTHPGSTVGECRQQATLVKQRCIAESTVFPTGKSPSHPHQSSTALPTGTIAFTTGQLHHPHL